MTTTITVFKISHIFAVNGINYAIGTSGNDSWWRERCGTPRSLLRISTKVDGITSPEYFVEPTALDDTDKEAISCSGLVSHRDKICQ